MNNDLQSRLEAAQARAIAAERVLDRMCSAMNHNGSIGAVNELIKAAWNTSIDLTAAREIMRKAGEHDAAVEQYAAQGPTLPEILRGMQNFIDHHEMQADWCRAQLQEAKDIASRAYELLTGQDVAEPTARHWDHAWACANIRAAEFKTLRAERDKFEAAMIHESKHSSEVEVERDALAAQNVQLREHLRNALHYARTADEDTAYNFDAKKAHEKVQKLNAAKGKEPLTHYSWTPVITGNPLSCVTFTPTGEGK